jgi:hypothetical protein
VFIHANGTDAQEFAVLYGVRDLFDPSYLAAAAL